jgi:chromosome partitioning protein
LPLLDAAMATFALAATADGEVSFAARQKVDEILQDVATLKAFDVHAATDRFKAFVHEIRSQPEKGRERALKAVSAMADDAEEARFLLRIACAVARVDGRYSPPGAIRIREIAGALGETTPDLENGDSPSTANDSKKSLRVAVGNQKGGTGKSTTAIHLAIGLLKHGHRVGCIDLDGQQSTLSHYLANRRSYAKGCGQDIPIPLYHRIEPAEARDRDRAEQEEKARLDEALADFADCDYVVVDTPGHHNHLARLGHASADVLITPLNDSFLDIDVLAQVDLERRMVVGPSVYGKMVMQQSEKRVAGGRNPLDWIVMRNRLAQLDARNTRDMTKLLQQLSKRMGFRIQPGLSERVVFRELFYNGLTLLDLPEGADEARFNPSHWNARQELRQLVDSVRACRQTGIKPWGRSRPKKGQGSIQRYVADLQKLGEPA